MESAYFEFLRLYQRCWVWCHVFLFTARKKNTVTQYHLLCVVSCVFSLTKLQTLRYVTHFDTIYSSLYSSICLWFVMVNVIVSWSIFEISDLSERDVCMFYKYMNAWIQYFYNYLITVKCMCATFFLHFQISRNIRWNR